MINLLKQPRKHLSKMSDEQANTIAIDALLFLTQNEDELFAFMNESGLLLADLRQRINDRQVLGCLLDYILANQTRLTNFCHLHSYLPENIVKARITMPGFSPEMRTVY